MIRLKKYLLVIMVCLSAVFVMSAIKPVTAKALTNPAAKNNLSVWNIRHSYLTALDNGGYMRVYTGDDSKDAICIEYYDKNFKLTDKKTVARELPEWGGFYKGSDAYYICEGKTNPDEKNDAEVIRVIRYDFNWKRLGAASITSNPEELWAAEVRTPFDWGTLEMTEYNGKLFLTTGHEAYVDESVGQGHQGYLLMMVDIASMKGKIIDADCWHSFAQYIDNDGKGLFIYEQSEGSRCTTIKQFNIDDLISGIESGRFDYWGMGGLEKYESVFEYGGSRTSVWSIPCYATVEGLALSDKNALGIGTSIDQSKYDSYEYDETPYNIYLTVTPKDAVSENKTSIKWLTSYSKSKIITGVHITKISNDRFLVTWGTNSSGQVEDINDPLSVNELHYLFIDGNGSKLTSEQTVRASFSECKPIINGDKAVFYSSDGKTIDFYSIDTNNGVFSKTVYRTIGENATWKISNGTLTISGSGSLYSCDDEGAFASIGDKVTKVIVKGSITSIPAYEFSGMSELKTVVIEEGVKSIGDEAFSYIYDLKDVHIPKSVTTIGNDIVWTGYYWIPDYSHVYYAVIHTSYGTAAYKYAKKNGIDYVVSLEDAIVTGIKNKYYTGKAVTQNPVVKLGNATLVKDIDYILTYKYNKAVGTATIAIKGIGKYSGTITKTFKIYPKKTAIKKLTSPKTKQLKVTYSKVSNVSGYQLSYSTSSKFTTKTTKTANTTATSKTISKLTKGKTYYVRVRTYKTVGKTKYYSGWSSVKKIKVK